MNFQLYIEKSPVGWSMELTAREADTGLPLPVRIRKWRPTKAWALGTAEKWKDGTRLASVVAYHHDTIRRRPRREYIGSSD